MLMELVEKKNMPIKTKVQFSKKEWETMHITVKTMYEKAAEKHETARNVYFIIDGDLINVGKKMN